jgi:AhpD family alkylhydroperoxidase
MQARMNFATALPDATPAIKSMIGAAWKAGVPAKTLHLVHMRISQINGCAVCLDGGAKQARGHGESDERLFAVAGWRDAPYYTDAERAALALAETVTRLSDREDAVPDAIWKEATRHFDEKELAGLLLWIATTNVFNRLNVATRQVAGSVKWD